MANYNPYQQGGFQPPNFAHGQFSPNGTQNQFAGTPQGSYQNQETSQQTQGYFSPQGQTAVNSDRSAGGLVSQMGSMGLGGDPTAPYRPNKKKDRHAYHNLEQPGGSSQPFNGQSTSHFYGNTVSSHPMSPGTPGHPYAGQSITPAMSQFPAQGGTTFSPKSQDPSQGWGQPQQPQVSSGPGVTTQGKVDPEQIPSIPRARDAAAQYYLDHIYPTMEQHIPPPAAVPFVAYDQGNSSPKFARLTLNNIPASAEALASTALPLGLVLQPLAPLQEGEQAVPVLDFGEPGPPRCRRCRTYINPFMTFRSGGNKFVCNMCTFPNDVSPEYFAPTDPTGVRVDRAQRPELTTGTVEFLVPKEYWAKEPVGLHWLFLIDVGQEAINRGFLQAFCEGIVNTLYGDLNEDAADTQENGDVPDPRRKLPLGSKVGFVTFDQAMYFFNCNVRFWVLDLSSSITNHFIRQGLSNRKCW